MSEYLMRKEAEEKNNLEIKNKRYEKNSDARAYNIIQDLNSKELLKGIILSEILGKPLSKRRRKR